MSVLLTLVMLNKLIGTASVAQDSFCAKILKLVFKVLPFYLEQDDM